MLLLGYLLLALVVAAVLFYLVVAFLPSGLSVSAVRDDRPLELPPTRRMRMGDLDRVRIPVSVRGYRFAETDELIDRLAAEIVVRDEEIARLKQQGYPLDADAGASVRPSPTPSPEPEWAVRDMGSDAAVQVAEFEDAQAERAEAAQAERAEAAQAEAARADDTRADDARATGGRATGGRPADSRAADVQADADES